MMKTWPWHIMAMAEWRSVQSKPPCRSSALGVLGLSTALSAAAVLGSSMGPPLSEWFRPTRTDDRFEALLSSLDAWFDAKTCGRPHPAEDSMYVHVHLFLAALLRWIGLVEHVAFAMES